MGRNQFIAIGAIFIAIAVVAYQSGRAQASGVPANKALVYSGILTDSNGALLSGSKNIQIQIWDQQAAGSGNVLCQIGPSPYTLTFGAFSVTLPEDCTSIVHSKNDLWVEVFVDGASMDRHKLGAVPFALEADSASKAAGQLEQRIASIENRLTPGVVYAECTAPWSQGLNAAGNLTMCSAKITVPWPALMEASITGHIRSSGGQRCTVGITVDDDLPPRDLCCSTTESAFGVILNHNTTWTPASTSRHKEVSPGVHTVSYLLNHSGSSAGECSYNGSTMFVRAFRL